VTAILIAATIGGCIGFLIAALIYAAKDGGRP